MIYCILSILILVLLYTLIYHFTYDDDTASMVTILVFLVLVLTPEINNFAFVSEPVEYQEVECTITGLELIDTEKTKINGAFILGTGTIVGSNSSNIQYVFFANTMISLSGISGEITIISSDPYNIKVSLALAVIAVISAFFGMIFKFKRRNFFG